MRDQQVRAGFGHPGCLLRVEYVRAGDQLAFGGKLPGLGIEQALAQTPGGAAMGQVRRKHLDGDDAVGEHRVLGLGGEGVGLAADW